MCRASDVGAGFKPAFPALYPPPRESDVAMTDRGGPFNRAYVAEFYDHLGHPGGAVDFYVGLANETGGPVWS